MTISRIFVEVEDCKVSDLIKILQAFPPDQRVIFVAYVGQWRCAQISSTYVGTEVVLKIEMR